MGVGEIDGSVWLPVFGGLVIQDAWVGDTAGRGGSAWAVRAVRVGVFELAKEQEGCGD